MTLALRTILAACFAAALAACGDSTSGTDLGPDLPVTDTGVEKVSVCQPVLVSPVNVPVASCVPVLVHRVPTCAPVLVLPL